MRFFVKGPSGGAIIGAIVLILFLLAAIMWMGGQNPQKVGEPTDERCFQKPVAGPCKGLIYGYYFDQKDALCREFMWGGCEGVRPFASMDECKMACEVG